MIWTRNDFTGHWIAAPYMVQQAFPPGGRSYFLATRKSGNRTTLLGSFATLEAAKLKCERDMGDGDDVSCMVHSARG